MTTTTAYVLYALITLGAAGLYFLLPKTGRNTKAAGILLSVAALIGLLGYLISMWAGDGASKVNFYVFAGLSLFGAFRVITHDRPVYSALYFILVVFAVAGMLLLQDAEFLAAALVLIYAGAILVTYVFVIMLAQQSGASMYDTRSRDPLGGVMAGLLLTAAVSGQVGQLRQLRDGSTPVDAKLVADEGARRTTPTKTIDDSAKTRRASMANETSVPGNTERMGMLLMTRYVVAVELAGLLLLIAMVGAIAMARKRLAPGQEHALTGPNDDLPVGHVGRHVDPY
jgi:NADH-quinone oxidoreductase subunit J